MVVAVVVVAANNYGECDLKGIYGYLRFRVLLLS